MKKSICTILLATFFVNFGFSQNLENLQKNSAFKDFKKGTEQLLKNDLDIELIRSIMKDDKVDANEYKEVPEALGFGDLKAYEAYMNEQLAKAAEVVEKEFGPDIEVWKAMFKVLEEEIVDPIKDTACKANRAACFVHAELGALIGHASCAQFDWLIVTAPWCHSHVAMQLVLRKNACERDFEKCMN